MVILLQRGRNVSIYHVPMTEQEKGEYGSMCNLGEAILERGMEQGIKAFIELCKELGMSMEETGKRLQTKFVLQEQVIDKYVKKYYK